MKTILTDFEPKPSTSKGVDHSLNDKDKPCGKNNVNERKGSKNEPCWYTNSDTEDEGKILVKFF